MTVSYAGRLAAWYVTGRRAGGGPRACDHSAEAPRVSPVARSRPMASKLLRGQKHLQFPPTAVLSTLLCDGRRTDHHCPGRLTFASFRAAIEETIAQMPTTHAASLASLMTLNFQRFENVSLMAA